MLNKLYEKVNFSSEELNIIHNYMATSIHSTIQNPIALDSISIDRLLLLRLKISRFLEVLPEIYQEFQKSQLDNNLDQPFVIIDELFIESFKMTLQIITADIEKRRIQSYNSISAL
ncbi:hypothetical protein ACWGKR_24430 [Bacillus thuringiensis]|uniref:hypothetical protein n=1 Tax=Bacillus thuringiensis TaxID=1428 RepID=UPI0021D65F87|nr:hypothetical protein [Bacillus thuringiensis]MCU7679300.1 hypothetical protein [Bacillus thuringiensis]